ncbi:MAG TPA: GNAT family N-acetyltransferase [Gemmataceae bacterium]
MNPERIVCWEALAPEDPVLLEARRLYETTQAPDEQIPWEWIGSAAAKRHSWRPGRWSPHLLLAAPLLNGDIGPLAGFAYGAHIPGFGGYVCYLGVDPAARQRGVATRLFGQMFRVLAVDAGAEGTELPFILWESHRPGAAAPEEEWKLWGARLRLFERVGAYWVEGIDFQSPNFHDPAGPPIPLQLFLKPWDRPAEAFDAASLRAIAAGLHRNVYRNGPGDPLFDRTFPPGCAPRLRPAREAERPRPAVVA